MKQLYRAHCKQTLDTSSIEQEVLSEYDRQREFLEKTVDTLKHKLHQEVNTHKAERGRDMLVTLILLFIILLVHPPVHPPSMHACILACLHACSGSFTH